MLFGVWDIFVGDCGDTLNLSANFIFIPINIDDHIACLCINFKALSVDILDNQKYPDPENARISKACNILVSAMSDYLDSKGFESRASDVAAFNHRFIKFDWTRPSPNNEESGIFTMAHMLMYEGEPFKHEDVVDKRNRRFLICEFAAALVLADMNTKREKVLATVRPFTAGIEKRWEAIQAGRRISKIIAKSTKSQGKSKTT
ncbi:hypothetical protein RND81_04G060700 [Saponaria officinalis]|uniref:Ubiquitin-like protease family profile domain-containing protein n=1 Tax=Saponaria officinalis TaxID=3572 RepID=A0AAW1LIF3_SAPOF